MSGMSIGLAGISGKSLDTRRRGVPSFTGGGAVGLLLAEVELPIMVEMFSRPGAIYLCKLEPSR